MERMSEIALLLSPAPVDGYPPVQHQARLLAGQGYLVELITVPRFSNSRNVAFSHAGVHITVLPLRTGRGLQTIIRLLSFSIALIRLRFRYRRYRLVEIDYDPLAMLISDLTPFRPLLRIAHFHESLDAIDRLWLQYRLKNTIQAYQQVVVADHARSELLTQQLNLKSKTIVVPNYPLRLDDRSLCAVDKKKDVFEVIYAGSIGKDQKLDVVLEALKYCPENVSLTLLGNSELPTAKDLLRRAKQLGIVQRLHMPGWLDYQEVPRRLACANLAVSFYNPDQINTRNSVGASNKRYEYMRAGLPQIGDMNPGVPELIEGNRIGRCVQSYSPRELANLICEYAANPARCMEEGTHARKLHEEIFNYQTAFEPLLKLINNYLANINCNLQ